MSDTVFVPMYHPALGNVQVDAPLQAVATYQSHGWLLVDPNATPPPVASPYLSQPAADSRYLRDWAGAEVLTAGSVRVAPDGHVIVRVADGTSRSTYDATEQALWTALGGANDPALRAAFDAEIIARGPAVLESARYQNLPTPTVGGHRANLAIYPENTLEALRASIATGSIDLNVDTYPLTDGSVGVIHDDTTDRTTTASANVTDLDSPAFQQLVIDTPTWFAPNSPWGNLKAPLAEQVFREFGNKVHMGIEAKPATGSGVALVKLLQRYGIHPDTVGVTSFLMSELVAPHAAGFQTAYITTAANHSTTDPAALVAAGVNAVIIDPTSADLQTQAQRFAEVQRFTAAGVKVAVAVFQRRWDMWPWIAAGGVVNYGADDDAYMNVWTWVPRTTDSFKSGNVPRGSLSAFGTQSFQKGTFVGNVGHTRWQAPSNNTWSHRGDLGPIRGAIESSLQATVSAGATSIRVGPANKPVAGMALTLDGPPASTRAGAVGTGGTFAAGTYYWAATAVTASGESAASVETSAVIAANGSATITGVAPIGTTSINIYRGTASGAENVLVGQATVSTAARRPDLTVPTTFTFTDTGATGTSQSPPAAGATETVTPTADGVIQSDGTYLVTVPALAKTHAAGTRVYGGTWTITANIAIDATGSDTGRWAAIVVGAPDDQIFDNGAHVSSTGYLEQIRINGQMTNAAIKHAASVTLNGTFQANTQAIAAPIVLSADLVSGAAITALPIAAAASAIVSGQKFILPTGQTATASSAVTLGATSVPISSLTPSALVPSGTSLSAYCTISVQRTATQLIFKRTDLVTQYSTTLNDTAFFGGYLHFGQLDQGAGMLASWFGVSITTP